MATVTGKDGVKSFLASIPAKMVPVLRGAGRAGGSVIAEEAKARVTSDHVREKIKVKTKVEATEVRATVVVDAKGITRSKAWWLEYGTSPHFISVDDSQRGGRGIRRINTQVREAKGDGSLVIGGKFVGDTVFHPGAQAHPFMRPALDLKEQEAFAAAQAYINSKVKPGGVDTSDPGDDA